MIMLEANKLSLTDTTEREIIAQCKQVECKHQIYQHIISQSFALDRSRLFFAKELISERD